MFDFSNFIKQKIHQHLMWKRSSQAKAKKKIASGTKKSRGGSLQVFSMPPHKASSDGTEGGS
jgi:hypothetical protein